jgi:hypothetical protein
VSLSQVSGCLSCQHGISLERLLPHLAGVVVEAAELAGSLCLWARARADHAVCPRCGQMSGRVHSTYGRRLADAPVGGLHGLGGHLIARSLTRMHLAAMPGVIFAIAVTFMFGVVFAPGPVFGITTVIFGGSGALLLYVLLSRALGIGEFTELTSGLMAPLRPNASHGRRSATRS